MNRIVGGVLTSAFILAIGCHRVPGGNRASAAKADGAFMISPATGSIEFDIEREGGPVHGAFSHFWGTLQFDPAHVERSTAMLTISTGAVRTSNNSDNIKSQDFLDCEHFSVATFRLTSIQPTDADASMFYATSDIMVRGNTRQIAFPIRLRVERDILHVAADVTINRRAFGINTALYGRRPLRDEVVVHVAFRVPYRSSPTASPLSAPRSSAGR